MPYSSGGIFRHYFSHPLTWEWVCKSKVLWHRPLITTSDPTAFPGPRSSRSPYDWCSHIPPLPWCLQRCFLPFWISGGRSLQEPSSEAAWAPHPAPAAALQCHREMWNKSQTRPFCPLNRRLLRSSLTPCLCKATQTGRAQICPRFQI